MGLEPGQLVLLDQFLDEFIDALGVGFGRQALLELSRGNDAGVLKLLNDCFKGDGHRRIPGHRKTKDRPKNNLSFALSPLVEEAG